MDLEGLRLSSRSSVKRPKYWLFFQHILLPRMSLASSIVGTMEEPGEQCTVVFALIVTEPGSECVCVCVCVWREVGGAALPP